jgi:hypothetical protein
MAGLFQSLPEFLAKAQRRTRATALHTSLSLRHWLKRQTVWVDYGCIKLPFHDDGDLQELHYHLEGKYWWQYEMGEIAPCIKPGFYVVDIGANLGFMSGLFSRLTGADEMCTASNHPLSSTPSCRRLSVRTVMKMLLPTTSGVAK